MKSSFPGIKRLLKLESTTSTQDFARGLAKEGAKEGTLVWALRQTSGRGRMERRWHSAGGGLYFSLILKPPFPPSKLADFSLLTAEAAAEAISDLTDLRMEVKPPNDVVTRDSEGVLRKVCGILAEASGGATSLDWLVVGIGINVNNAPRMERGALPAGSLKGLTGKPWPLETVLEGFLREFHRRYRRFSTSPSF